MLLVSSLLQVQNIGFAELVNSFNHTAQQDSSFRRIQRIF